MELAAAAVGEIAKEVSNSVLDRVKRHAGYILDRKKNVEDLKAKVEDLHDARERVERAVQAAKRNGEEIAADVNRWLERVGEIMEKNAEEVKPLEDQAMNRCFMCCPNVKCYHQLGKKAQEHAAVVAELLQRAQLFDKVSYHRAPESNARVPTNYYDFQSRSNLVGEIMKALPNPDVKMVGLHGLPGVGKTMLVNAVGKKASEEHSFDEVVIAAVSHNPNIRSIQEEVAEQLGLRFDSVKSESGRANLLSQRLSGDKKVLVILDDVWEKIELDNLGISFGDDKNITSGDEKAGSTSGSSYINTSTGRSKILLTSRISDVLDQMNAEMKFECEFLSREEAMELFASIVGSAVVTNPAYNSIANQLVEICGGLPVAVSAIANAMKNKSPGVWENALTELKRLNPANIDKMDSVYSIIKLSYTLLKSEEAQSLLELCALQGQAFNISLSYMVRYGLGMRLLKEVFTLEEARIKVSALVEKLKSSSLLLSGNNDATVKMHDLIRDVSLSTVSKEKQMIVIENDTHLPSLRRDGKLDNCTAISLPFSDVHDLPSVLECPNLKLLLLFCKDKFQLQVPDLFFKKTNDLRVLNLTGMHFPSLPSSFPCLTNLRTLCLDQCKLGTITGIANLKKLEILSFYGSEIMQLPNEIGELTELRSLDLSNCSNLEVIPANVLSKLSSLEELYMGNSFHRWAVNDNASLTELSNLKHLTNLHVHVCDAQIEILSTEDVFPETLRRFRIFLGDIPWDCLNEQKYSRTLKLKVTARINWDRGIRTLLKKAEELYVDELKGFQSLLYELDYGTSFPDLKNLHVENNSEIQYIINSNHGISSEAFPLVESLLLHDLINLKKIFHGQIYSGCFRRLRTIEVRNCDSLKSLFSLSLATHFLQQLQEIEVSDCSAIIDILGAHIETANQEAIVLGELQSITLQSLPNLISFCFGEEKHSTSHHGQVASTLSSVPLFSKEIEFPKLQKLKLCSINIESIWHSQYQLQTSFQNLTSLIIEGCDNLKHILSYSMVDWLQQLQVFEINNCKHIREIIATEETTVYEDRATSLFPCLKILRIEECPELKGFINKSSSKDISSGNTNEVVLFNEEVAFPNLERLTVSHLRNVKWIWYNQPNAFSYSKLKELTVEYCDALLNVFPSSVLGAFQSLEMLKVTDCSSLEEVFDIKETCSATMQLRRLYLHRLPKLKHVWNKNPHGNTIFFKELRLVNVWECWSLKSLFPFSIAKGLQQLERLQVSNCGVEEIISKNSNSEGLEQETTRFEFNWLSSLMLWNLPYLACFCEGMYSTIWPKLKSLWTHECEKKIKIFGQPNAEPQIRQPLLLIDEVIPQLEEVWFSVDDITMICDRQCPLYFFSHIKVLGINFNENESTAFPFHFLQRFPNLEHLLLASFAFKDLSPYNGDLGEEKHEVLTLPKFKKLRLDNALRITHLWDGDSPMGCICANLETLQVWQCYNLISLGSSSTSFENLTTLDVWKCNRIAELITSSKAQSLVNLVTMKIRECEMIKQVVVASDEGQDDDAFEITFPKLKWLELDRLQSLGSFCSGNYIFKFPSLVQVIVSQCPSLKIFCPTALSTPKLQRVQLKDTDSKGRWAGDLNATLQQLHKEKHLKFSENPKLVNIWNIRNPQEIVDFKNLEFLEVCNSDNLRYILNLSMASSLNQLQVLEIKRCNNLEAVIMEEEATVTTDDKNITIFPLLKSIVIENCPDLKSFYSDNDKQAIISEGIKENNGLTSFFCHKVAFPNLETLNISHLRNLKRIWCNQLHEDSFCKLKALKVEYCDQLLNIFPSSPILGMFQRLETLQVTDCGSLELLFGIKDTCVAATIQMQLRNLTLCRLPKLKYVWNFMDPRGNNSFSFQNLRRVVVRECWSLKSVFPFSIAKGLQQLQHLDILMCGVEEIISKNINSEGSEQETRFEFNQVFYLQLWDLPYLKCFYPGKHNATWPALKKLYTCECEKKIKIFDQPDAESQIQQPLFWIDEVIPQLEGVSFSSDDIAMICARQFALADDFFCHIGVLAVTSYLNESTVLPFAFLQRFSNLRFLALHYSNFRDLSFGKGYDDGDQEKQVWTLPKVRQLRLNRLDKIRYLWDEDSLMGRICANLETLEIWRSDSLISLGSSSASFENLTALDVWKCNGIAELITSSKAQSLVRLVAVKIRECEMIKQVVVASNEGDEEETSEMIFPELRYLELDRLQSLESFCSGNYTFKFSSLVQVIVSKCPSMKSFCHGALSTPRLRNVQLKQTDYQGRWAGDLNATIQQIAQLSA